MANNEIKIETALQNFNARERIRNLLRNEKNTEETIEELISLICHVWIYENHEFINEDIDAT